MLPQSCVKKTCLNAIFESALEREKLIFLTGVNASLDGKQPSPKSFSEYLTEQKLLSSSIDSSVKKLICIDYSFSVAAEIRRLGLSSQNCTLVHMEPSVVLPANFARTRRRQFGRIITVGGLGSQNASTVLWPLGWPSTAELAKLHATSRTERVIVINGNKMSFVKGELYSLRRAAIKNLEKIDLFGTQWESRFLERLLIVMKALAHTLFSLKLPQLSGLSLWFRDFSESKGAVVDKLTTMSAYKYALVIENSAEYMSEKLFDAFFAGCLPIYVGPPLEKFGIPEKLVFQAEANLDSISRAIRQARDSDHNKYLRDLKYYLESGETISKWSRESVYSRILEIVNKEE